MSHRPTIEQIKDHILELKENGAPESEIKKAEDELAISGLHAKPLRLQLKKP